MSNESFNLVLLGGTFSPLHKGHKHLILFAHKISKKVLIGITADPFANVLSKSHPIFSFEKRLKDLYEFLRNEGLLNRTIIVPILDPYGPSILRDDADAIVVSNERISIAEEINKIRERKGLKRLSIIIIGLILAEDGKPIKSTRIWNREIDKSGKLLSNN